MVVATGVCPSLRTFFHLNFLTDLLLAEHLTKVERWKSKALW